MQANQTIRATAKAQKIPLWRIAAQMGISEPTLTRWLRVLLSEEREKAIMEAIEAIAKEMEENG